MNNNQITLRPSYWASVSGGKDSLFMLKLILEHPDKYPLDGVVHFELEIDFPFIKKVVNYMRSECEKHKIRFVTVRPTKSFYELYEKCGFPSRNARWCNSMYKMDAKRQLQNYLKSQGSFLVSYIGFCADEVKRFNFDLNERPNLEEHQNVSEIYPIAEFGIEEISILEWARNVPLFNDYYKYNKRCGCMYCPLQDMTTTAYLLKYYPNEYELFKKMVQEHENRMCARYGKQSFSVFQSNGKYNFEYRDKMVREKYLPKLEKNIEKSS